MGYTQHWRRPIEIPPDQMRAILRDFCRLIPALRDTGVTLAGPPGWGEPHLTGYGVSFNGPGSRGCEPFDFPRVFEPPPWRDSEDGLYSAFCKTAWLPYDLAVTAFLLVAKHHLPQLEVATDGKEEEWTSARQMCEDVLGYGREYHINSARELEISRSE